MPDDRVVVAFKIGRGLLRRLDHLAVDRDLTRQALVEEMLRRQIAERGTDAVPPR